MKSRWIAVLCLLVLMCVPALAQEKKPEGGPSAAEMEAWQKAMSPGPEHQRLARMAGDWTFTNKMWMDPSAPPAEGSGTMHAETILGGRYLHAVWKGNFMGMPFEGHAIEGYDNLTKKHVSSWVDNMSTAIMYSTGTCDANGKTCTMTSAEMPDPMTGKMTSARSVVTWANDNSFTFVMYMKPAGEAEVKGMEMTVTRK